MVEEEGKESRKKTEGGDKTVAPEPALGIFKRLLIGCFSRIKTQKRKKRHQPGGKGKGRGKGENDTMAERGEEPDQKECSEQWRNQAWPDLSFSELLHLVLNHHCIRQQFSSSKSFEQGPLKEEGMDPKKVPSEGARSKEGYEKRQPQNPAEDASSWSILSQNGN